LLIKAMTSGMRSKSASTMQSARLARLARRKRHHRHDHKCRDAAPEAAVIAGRFSLQGEGSTDSIE
jgi:hypothetical protein